MIITEFDAESLREQVGNQRPVLVDFWAPWCGSCRLFDPAVRRFAGDHAEVMVGKIDVDAHPQVAEELGVQSVPTLILFRNGQPVHRTHGAMSAESLEAEFRPYLDTAFSPPA